MLLCHVLNIFGEVFVQIVCPVFNGMIYFLVEFKQFFVYFGYKSLIRYIFGKYFLLVCDLSS
jgi:hypothetical protein